MYFIYFAVAILCFSDSPHSIELVFMKYAMCYYINFILSFNLDGYSNVPE